VRPAHFTSVPGQASNIYLLHFYGLYYLPFDYRFEIVELRKTQVKFPARFFTGILWPCMWFFNFITVIRAEKDPRQRRYNWEILSYLFDPALLRSDNIVVKARKLGADENRLGA